MPHKFHGEWKSFIVTFPGSGPRPFPDGNIYLRIEESNGTINTGSNHNGNPVRGRVTQVSLEIESDSSRYEGFLLDESVILGQRIITVGGRVIFGNRRAPNDSRTADEYAEDEATREGDEEQVEERRRKILAQEEGTWVATKTG